MKVAIDIHSTIDVAPRFFSRLTRLLKLFRVEIHITTGVPDSLALRHQLDSWRIRYDKVFSITNYHQSIGTAIRWDKNGDPWIEDELWNRTKADYCRRNRITLAIDDSAVYRKYFTTPFVLFTKVNKKEGKKTAKSNGLPFADWLVP